jgi:hypothetical protein
MPKAKPSGANQHKERSRNGTDPATLTELGLSKKRASRARKAGPSGPDRSLFFAHREKQKDGK